jgi:hypothetical protein
MLPMGSAPAGLARPLVEFRILNHHRVDDPEERFVAREQPHAAGERVPLHPSLTLMLGERLGDSTTAGIGELIPLETSTRRVQHSV